MQKYYILAYIQHGRDLIFLNLLLHERVLGVLQTRTRARPLDSIIDSHSSLKLNLFTHILFVSALLDNKVGLTTEICPLKLTF